MPVSGRLLSRTNAAMRIPAGYERALAQRAEGREHAHAGRLVFVRGQADKESVNVNVSGSAGWGVVFKKLSGESR